MHMVSNGVLYLKFYSMCWRCYVDIIFYVVLWFLADRNNGRAIGTVLHLSVICRRLSDVMYCG